jgi:hypothetical protein
VEADIDICNEFDNFVREMFEVEPPLGMFFINDLHSYYAKRD